MCTLSHEFGIQSSKVTCCVLSCSSQSAVSGRAAADCLPRAAHARGQHHIPRLAAVGVCVYVCIHMYVATHTLFHLLLLSVALMNNHDIFTHTFVLVSHLHMILILCR